MCKYCKFTYIDLDEKSNDVKRIKRIRYGKYVTDVSINRYQCDDNPTINELIIDDAVELRDGLYTVNETHIKINYCPFCGEKL